MKKTLPKKKEGEKIVKETTQSIIKIRGQSVIIDSDLAKIYGVETRRLNEQVNRNKQKFPPDFMFQLTKAEFDDLKSHFAISKSDWGGRRTLPLVFTEHGALMAANVLKSELANAMSVFVIRAFVQMRDVINTQKSLLKEEKLPLPSGASKIELLPEKMDSFLKDFWTKINIAMEQVLDSVIDPKRGTTVREEAQDLISQGFDFLKAKLQSPGLENEETAARIKKLLAEAEKEKETTRKTRAEAEQIEFSTFVKKLQLVLEVGKALYSGEEEKFDPVIDRIDAFLNALKKLTS
jgi:hypothetical protein